MGFKQEAAQKLAELDKRVGALEALAARHLGARYDASTPVSTAETSAARTTTTATAAPSSTGVDYAAIAFGLSEVKRKVAVALDSSSASRMASEYAGTVDYFADVFAKSDPSFNRNEFNRLAQR